MGWKDIHPVVTKVMFADGTVVEPPIIEVGEAGHIYRPPGFPDPQNKKRTTFGRGSKMQNEARRIVGDDYMRQIRRGLRDSHVLWIDTKYKYEDRGYGYGPSFTLHLKDSKLGAWVTICAWRETGYGYRRDTTTVYYRVSYPVWGHDFKHMDGIDLYKGRDVFKYTSVSVPYDTMVQANEALLRFKEDPTKVLIEVYNEAVDRSQAGRADAYKHTGRRITDTIGFLKGNEAWREAKRRIPSEHDWIPSDTTLREWDESGLHTVYAYDRGAEYLTREALGTVLGKQLKPLEELGKAIAVTGATFKLAYENSYPIEDRALKSLQITTPARDKVKGQEHEHKIVFSDRGIEVQCGYLEDEQKALEYEKRKIRQALLGEDMDAPIEETEWETTTYEIGKGA